MIDTANTQSAHLADGCWRSGTGEHVIMLVGSCRMLPFVNYLVRLNQDNRFTIVLVYVVNFTGITEQYETNPILLEMIKRCRWLVKEHCVNYGMFNTDKDCEKNIYQFGINPELDILVPSWNDHLILENDYAAYGAETPPDYIERGKAEIEKFCRLCELSSFPDFADYFRDCWKTTRFFWRPNHTSAAFTLHIFDQMDLNYLHLNPDEKFWVETGKEDLFKEPHTHVTQRDREGYGITW